MYNIHLFCHLHNNYINPLNAELNPICHLLTLLEAHHILHVSKIRVKITCLEIVMYSPSSNMQDVFSNLLHMWPKLI
jgi:hypothetical protein